MQLMYYILFKNREFLDMVHYLQNYWKYFYEISSEQKVDIMQRITVQQL